MIDDRVSTPRHSRTHDVDLKCNHVHHFPGIRTAVAPLVFCPQHILRICSSTMVSAGLNEKAVIRTVFIALLRKNIYPTNDAVGVFANWNSGYTGIYNDFTALSRDDQLLSSS